MLATTENRAGGLFFTTEGSYLLSDESWNDVRITSTYDACTSKIGLTPRYLNDNYYMTVTIEPFAGEHYLRVNSLLRGSYKQHAEVKLKTIIFPLTLSCEIKGSFVKILINDEIIHQFEFRAIPNGKIGLYAGANETCVSAKLEEPQGIGWTGNTSTKDVIIKQTEEEDETQELTLIGTTTNPAKITRTIKMFGKYILSLQVEGQGKIEIGSVKQDLSTGYCQIPVDIATEADTVINVISTGKLKVKEFQLEKGEFPTSYIPNRNIEGSATREESFVSFPAEDNISFTEGSLFLSVLPKGLAKGTWLVSDTNEFVLRYDNGSLSFVMGSSSVSASIPNDVPLRILLKWNRFKMQLIINDVLTEKVFSTAPVLKPAKYISFTKTDEVNRLAIDDFVTWSEFLPDIAIGKELPSQSNILLNATFNHGISGKGASWTELPMAPFDNSPILVEKRDGTNMQKVSFFDYETGAYRTYNEEMFTYDGRSDFFVLSFPGVDDAFFDLMIRTEEGEKIGEPYTIKDKQIWFSLSPEEKERYYHKGLYVRYQLNDSYTVDYNIKAVDGYRLDFAKHDGQIKKVYQEGNRWGEPYKLATMVEMNPIMNQNHEGFLYITQNDQVTSSFKVTVTPEHLPADGGSSCLILIEPVDKQGNFLGSVDLNVKVKYGYIHRVVSLEAADTQKRAGMYIYKYYAPFLSRKQFQRNVEELLWIIDQEENIGIQYKFLLRPMDKQHNQLFTADRQLLEEQKSHVFQSILLYEGLEEWEDPELFNALDINKDGKVTSEDIEYLESGLADKLVPGIYSKLIEWEAKQ